MVALSNARHERFAQERAKGKTADEAYVIAGFSENRGNAARLNANESVVKRIAEIQGAGAKRAETTVERLLEAAWEIIAEAREEKDFSAASSTLERAAKIAGKWVDRSAQATVSIEDLLDAADGRSADGASATTH